LANNKNTRRIVWIYGKANDIALDMNTFLSIYPTVVLIMNILMAIVDNEKLDNTVRISK